MKLTDYHSVIWKNGNAVLHRCDVPDGTHYLIPVSVILTTVARTTALEKVAVAATGLLDKANPQRPTRIMYCAICGRMTEVRGQCRNIECPEMVLRKALSQLDATGEGDGGGGKGDGGNTTQGD